MRPCFKKQNKRKNSNHNNEKLKWNIKQQWEWMNCKYMWVNLTKHNGGLKKPDTPQSKVLKQGTLSYYIGNQVNDYIWGKGRDYWEDRWGWVMDISDILSRSDWWHMCDHFTMSNTASDLLIVHFSICILYLNLNVCVRVRAHVCACVCVCCRNEFRASCFLGKHPTTWIICSTPFAFSWFFR
jgi:hypothetical protein